MTGEGLGYLAYTWFYVAVQGTTSVSLAVCTHVATVFFLCSRLHTSHWDMCETLSWISEYYLCLPGISSVVGWIRRAGRREVQMSQNSVCVHRHARSFLSKPRAWCTFWLKEPEKRLGEAGLFERGLEGYTCSWCVEYGLRPFLIEGTVTKTPRSGGAWSLRGNLKGDEAGGSRWRKV